MAVKDSDGPAGWLIEQIRAREPNFLRAMAKTMAEALISIEADAIFDARAGRIRQYVLLLFEAARQADHAVGRTRLP